MCILCLVYIFQNLRFFLCFTSKPHATVLSAVVLVSFCRFVSAPRVSKVSMYSHIHSLVIIGRGSCSQTQQSTFTTTRSMNQNSR